MSAIVTTAPCPAALRERRDRLSPTLAFLTSTTPSNGARRARSPADALRLEQRPRLADRGLRLAIPACADSSPRVPSARRCAASTACAETKPRACSSLLRASSASALACSTCAWRTPASVWRSAASARRTPACAACTDAATSLASSRAMISSFFTTEPSRTRSSIRRPLALLATAARRCDDIARRGELRVLLRRIGGDDRGDVDHRRPRPERNGHRGDDHHRRHQPAPPAPGAPARLPRRAAIDAKRVQRRRSGGGRAGSVMVWCGGDAWALAGAAPARCGAAAPPSGAGGSGALAAGDHAAAEADLAVVEHRRLARRHRPLRRVEVERKRSAATSSERARRVRLPVARLRRAPVAGGRPAIQLASAAATCRDSSHGWSWPCTTYSVFVAMSLRATNQGACSLPPFRCRAPLSPPMPMPCAGPACRTTADVLADAPPAVVLDRPGRGRGSGSGTRGTAVRR